MCSNPFKPPKPSPAAIAAAKGQDIPIRQPVLMPDGGDPNVVMSLKSRRRLTMGSMIMSGPGGTLGAPSTSSPLGTSGL